MRPAHIERKAGRTGHTRFNPIFRQSADGHIAAGSKFAGIGPSNNVPLAHLLEIHMKVKTGIRAGAQGGTEASHGGKPRPVGKGV
jgi:hypothetical protein